MKRSKCKVILILVAVLLITLGVPAEQAFADNPWKFTDEQGMQPAAGDNGNNRIGLVELGIDNNYSQLRSDVVLLEKNKEKKYYLNEITGIVSGTKSVEFPFVMDAGMGNFSEENFIRNNLTKIKIYDEDENNIVASGNDSNTGEIVLKGTHKITETGAQGARKTDAIIIEIKEGVLSTGNYILSFGRDIYGNDKARVLGMDVKFKFRVMAAPSLNEMISRAEEYLAKCSVGDGAGEYSQEALDNFIRDITDAKAVNDDESATEENRILASERLYAKFETFKSCINYSIDEIKISGIGSEVNVGDKGTAVADVVTQPDWKEFKDVTWSAVKESKEGSEVAGNIKIDSNTGSWSAVYAGKCFIKVTSIKDKTKSSYYPVNVKDEAGTDAINIIDNNISLRVLIAESGKAANEITSLRVITGIDAKITKDDIDYINGLANLESLDLSEANLASLPDRAFEGNKSIKSVYLPDSVEHIGIRAFYDCSNLEAAPLPAGLDSIGKNAFGGCESMSETLISKVVCPPSFESVKAEENPFSSLTGQTNNIKKVQVPYGCKEDYEKSDIWKDFEIVESEQRRLTVHFTESGKLEDAASQALDDNNVKESDVTDLIIKSSEDVTLNRLNDIEGYLEKHFVYATTIDLSETKFENNTCNANLFRERRNLKTMILPEKTGSIGKFCFYGCKNLKNIVFPESIKQLGESSFAECSSLPDTIVIMSKEPPELRGTVFPSQVKAFRVPPGSEDKYKSDDNYMWNQFEILPQIELSFESTGIGICAGSKDKLKLNLITYNGNSYRVAWNVNNQSVLELSSVDSKLSSSKEPSISYQLVEIKALKPGVATVTASVLSGKYEASCTINVRNAVDAPVSMSVKSSSYNTLKVTWSKASGTEGYEVLRSTKSTSGFEKIATLPSTVNSYSNYGLQAGTKYYYKVRGFKTIDGVRQIGEYSHVASATPVPAAPTKITIGKASSSAIKIKFSKALGASGYQTYMATSKSGKYSKAATVKKTTRTVTVKVKTKKRKTYYYKVRAYRKVGKKYVYGAFSAPKAYKLK